MTDDRLSAARDIRDKILRGDLMIGILPFSAIAEMEQAYRAAGEAGSAEAWRELAECFSRGVGVDQVFDEAEACYAKAAELGDRDALMGLIRLRMYVTQQEPEATRALVDERLADDEDGKLHVLAGYMHSRGFAYPKDDARAYALHTVAAERGNTDGMFELYVLSSNGQGVEANPEEALRWCKKAAEADHPRACYNLGAFHATGRGVEQSWPECVRWYERAARAGNGRAAVALSMMYESGEGVEADPEKAQHWDQVAIELGA